MNDHRRKLIISDAQAITHNRAVFVNTAVVDTGQTAEIVSMLVDQIRDLLEVVKGAEGEIETCPVCNAINATGEWDQSCSQPGCPNRDPDLERKRQEKNEKDRS